MNANTLRIVPIGGMGNVTRNMFVYEYGNEMLLVDCGIGFPEKYMLGVDILIPDVSYVQKRVSEGAKIVGLCLTHGHDDHIAALPYIVPELPGDFPIYGSPLTAAFAKARMLDAGIEKDVLVYEERIPTHFGTAFSVDPVQVTHSVPDTRHLAIRTPEGVVYHGSDFKFDMTPIDGVRPDFQKMGMLGSKGVLCALVDCLRIERGGWSASEATVFDTLEAKARDCEGKLIVTLMSSNIHRIQQVVDVAVEHNRKIVFVGRSIEQNTQIAQELGMLQIPKGAWLHKRRVEEVADKELCVIIAGSQGQPGSSLVRAVFGEHPFIRISTKDRVIFSADPIPGNENNVYDAIDELSRNGIDVAYSDVDDHLHVTGHAGKLEQQMLISLLRPQYLLPIGGTDRHRVQFARSSYAMGYPNNRLALPVSGQVVEFSGGKMKLGETIPLRDLMVDGLGVGDVGTVVLSDRKNMAEEGMVTVIIPERSGRLDLENIYVASRGFVFMKKAEGLVEAIKEETANVLRQETAETNDAELKRKIEKRLTKLFEKMIGRTPLVIPVFFSV